MDANNPGKAQAGATLLEVLVSIVVLALGLLGILGVQMRTLAETQTGVRRAQAIRLIEDLSERIQANPSAISEAVRNAYVIAWGPSTAPTPCAAPGCAPEALANEQVLTWKQSVTQNLPSGDAATFLVTDEASAGINSRQLGVMLSWRENESSNTADYMNIFTTSTTSGAVSCPAEKTCHLQFISLSGRCAPDALAGASGMWYCSPGIVPMAPPA